MSISFKQLTFTLGIAGLIPFLLSVWAAAVQVTILTTEPVDLFVFYSAIILTFLAGSLWGRNLDSQENELRIGIAVLSNAIALIGWACLWFATSFQILVVGVLSVAYLVVLLTEVLYQPRLYYRIDSSYLKLRFALSSIVFVLHLTMLFLVGF